MNPRLSTFWADRSGAVMILAAFMMPVLVGGMGLGAEIGYRYYNQRLLQHAADVAAHAGAVRKLQGDTKAQIDAAALNVAVSSEYDLSVAVVPMAVNIPPASGPNTGNASAVEVILTETRPALLSAIWSDDPVTINARAVAMVTNEGSGGCILALSGNKDGAVTVTGNFTADLKNCAVVSNSTSSKAVSLPNGASILKTECISTSGGISTNQNAQYTTNQNGEECEKTGEPPTQDPYYWVMEPPKAVVPCQTTYGKNGNVGTPNKETTVTATQDWTHPDGTALKVMRFCDGLDAKGIVTFAPGLYIIEGGTLTSSGATTATLKGTGVTFYFTKGVSTKSGALNVGSNTTLNLSAPTTGPYRGILFFGDRTDPVAHTIQGNPSSVLEGAIYMSASEVKFSGNSAASGGCTQIIADSVTLTGSSTLTAECPESIYEQILVNQLVAIVE